MPDKVKVCPNCGSRDVRVDMGYLVGLGVPSQYRCENCDFMAVMFPEVEREEASKIPVEDPKKAPNASEKVDVNFGRFIMGGTKMWWKFVSPVIAAFSAYFVYVTVSNPGASGFYTSLALLVISVFTVVLSYVFPDKMSVGQSRLFGLLIVGVTLASVYFGFQLLSPILNI